MVEHAELLNGGVVAGLLSAELEQAVSTSNMHAMVIPEMKVNKTHLVAGEAEDEESLVLILVVQLLQT